MHKLIRTVAVLGALAGVAACNPDKLTNVNKNPNAPEYVAPELLFPNAQTAILGQLRGTSFQHGMEALWVQHYAEVQYPEADLYNPRGATIDALWANLYVGGLQDLRQAMDEAGANTSLTVPATIMRAVAFQEMTDIWGDIPFSAANSGQTGDLAPAYDAQSVIYDSLLTELKAVNTTAWVGNGYGSADLVYGGARTQWLKLANGLRARMALRLLGTPDSARGKAELQDVFATGPVFTSNADNAQMFYPGDGVNNNPLYNNWLTRDDQRLSNTFVDTLLNLNDPRLAEFADPTDSSLACATPGCYPTYVGAQNGLNANPGALPLTSRPDENNVRAATSPSIIMTYSELLFIRAEAELRTIIAGTPGTTFGAAIQASMDQWGVDPTASAPYVAAQVAAFNAASPARQLQMLALQKWISLFDVEMEAYSEWRRLGYPVLTPGPDAVITTVPRRLTYPAVESSLNAANLTEAITRQGGDELTTPVWWDK